MHVRPFFHPLSSIYIFWKYYIIRRYWKVFYCIHICRVKQIFLGFIDVPLQDATLDNHLAQILTLIAIIWIFRVIHFPDFIFNYFIFLIATWSWIFHENFKLYTDYILFGKIVGVFKKFSQVFSRVLLRRKDFNSHRTVAHPLFSSYIDPFSILLDLSNCNTYLTVNISQKF